MEEKSIKKETLNRREAARYLGVSPQTLANWRCSGTNNVPMIKVGDKCVYRREELDEWMERRRVGDNNKKETR